MAHSATSQQRQHAQLPISYIINLQYHPPMRQLSGVKSRSICMYFRITLPTVIIRGPVSGILWEAWQNFWTENKSVGCPETCLFQVFSFQLVTLDWHLKRPCRYLLILQLLSWAFVCECELWFCWTSHLLGRSVSPMTQIKDSGRDVLSLLKTCLTKKRALWVNFLPVKRLRPILDVQGFNS